MTREKTFPITVTLILMAIAVAVFVVVDAYTGFTANGASYFSRLQAQSSYWLQFKMNEKEPEAALPPPEGPAKSIPVLLYHGEGSDAVNLPLAVSVDQLRALKNDGWRTITLQQFHDFMKHGTPVPDKSFLLTFDDGRRDTFYPIDPVLKDLGFTGVMYVITAFSLPADGTASRFYLNEDELQYMVDSGRWELQSHGHEDHRIYKVQSTTDLTKDAETLDGNFLSNKFWKSEEGRFETDEEFAARIREDLEISRDILEQRYGRPVYTFAYPFNDVGQESVNFPGSIGIIARVVPSVYTFAFYQHWPSNGDSFNYADPDVFMVRRIEPKGSWSGEDLLAILNRGYAKSLPYEPRSFGEDWAVVWGRRVLGEKLTLSADMTSGASTFLDGTGWWTDYIFTADVTRIAGESVSLLARNKDDMEYIACVFEGRSIAIEKQFHDTSVILARVPAQYASQDLSIGIKVDGGNATCYLEGRAAVSSSFSGLRRGGIGIEVWDAIPGAARSQISNLAVRAI